MAKTIANHIEATPGVCGGKPRIAGHRIRVEDVVIWYERLGNSPSEIVSQHPGITLADVYAALAYYHDHQDEIRKDIEARERFVAEMEREYPSNLAEKLKSRHGGTDSVSS